jgi:hypothetical protein
LKAFGKDEEVIFIIERSGAAQPLEITVKKTEYVLRRFSVDWRSILTKGWLWYYKNLVFGFYCRSTV